ATGKDEFSKDIDPVFVDASMALFTPTAAAAGNYALAFANITQDIFGDPRNPTNPDVGAIEWTAQGLDAAISWVSRSGIVTPGLTDIIVNISNTSSTTINNVELSYSDGTTTVNQIFSSLNLLSGANVNLTFSSQYNVGAYAELFASIISVNGIADDEPTNNV